MPISNSKSKSIGITLGDPGGIGPEVIAKALQKTSIRKLANFVIIGDSAVYSRYAKRLYPNCSFLDLKKISKKQWQPGKSNHHSAKASLAYLEKSVELLKNKDISALVTAPVCKETICRINNTFQGHTEFLADAFKTKHVGMMFAAKGMRTMIVTRHIPLKKVSNFISTNKVYESIKLAYSALRNQFKIKKPLIGICGLNPHAGEGGTLGREELTKIIPAIKKARRHHMDIEGPFAADTIFSPDVTAQFDAVIAMYHDQGLIPVKTLYFTELVNLTVGLPFIRTSPAHGTAFNIAGQNIANPSSMCEAIKLAAQLS